MASSLSHYDPHIRNELPKQNLQRQDIYANQLIFIISLQTDQRHIP
jgi:hypothetical protein